VGVLRLSSSDSYLVEHFTITEDIIFGLDTFDLFGAAK
jgi:hypothetical protein